MTPTRQFIEDAIAGGWNASRADVLAFGSERIASEHNALLDPEAWKAVGKTRWKFPHRVGSHSDDRGGDSDLPCHCLESEYKRYMHRFIDHLADGKTTDEALKEIT